MDSFLQAIAHSSMVRIGTRGGGGGCIVAPRHAPCCLYFQFAPADGVDVGRPRAEPVLYQPRDRQVVLAKSQCSPQPPPA